MTKLLFTIVSALLWMRFSTSGRQLWCYEEKYVFRVLVPKDTVVDYLIKEHMFWPSPSSASSESWAKKKR